MDFQAFLITANTLKHAQPTCSAMFLYHFWLKREQQKYTNSCLRLLKVVYIKGGVPSRPRKKIVVC